MTDTVTTNGYNEPAYIYRLQLNTPDPEKPEENASMMFGLDGDTPEIMVWPRGDSQKGKAPIRARLNTTAFGNHLPLLLRRAAEGEPGFKGTLPVLANRYEDGRPVQKTVSTIICGKRKDGVVVLGLFDVDDSRPRILFPLTQLDWVGMPVINGEPLDEAALSVETAKYYAQFFQNLTNNTALRQTTAQRKAFMDELRRRREERQNGGTGTRKPLPSPVAEDFQF